MRKIYVFLLFAILSMTAGCKKDNDENMKETPQNTSEKNNDSYWINTEPSQESEYSAEKADVVLEELGIKSYDIWKWLRPETGEETDKFLNQEFDKSVSNISSEYLEEKQQNREQEIEKLRELIHGRYKVEQENPLIIKVNCKDENKYMTEERFGEMAYTYLSKDGFLVKNGDKWYEICGYGDYRENLRYLASNHWMYNVAPFVMIEYNAYGFDKRDEKTYDEEKIKEIFIPEMHFEEEFEERTYKYICENFDVNVYCRLYEEREDLERGRVRDVHICFYTMLDEYRAVTCYLWVVMDNTGYYNEITEEMLREIFTIREYK